MCRGISLWLFVDIIKKIARPNERRIFSDILFDTDISVKLITGCLLPLGAEIFVFQFGTQKFKDQDI